MFYTGLAFLQVLMVFCHVEQALQGLGYVKSGDETFYAACWSKIGLISIHNSLVCFFLFFIPEHVYNYVFLPSNAVDVGV